MKITTLLPVLILLGSTQAADVECKEKTDTCENRVEVTVTDMVYGLKDDMPVEVFQAFVEASSQCLQCVDKTDISLLDGVDNQMSFNDCKYFCFCCESWCPTWCPEQCYVHYPQCDAGGRRLADEYPPEYMSFGINVCMDDVTPLDSGASSYVDYSKMLDDFESQLADCYAAEDDKFLNSWSSLCAESGIDLSLMARDDSGTGTVLFGVPAMYWDTVKVTTYTSSDTHRSTSNMIFYSVLGFVALSVFAVVGTVVVVKEINKRGADKEEREEKWIAELASVDTAKLVK
jgi:hypothetical protein